MPDNNTERQKNGLANESASADDTGAASVISGENAPADFTADITEALPSDETYVDEP